MGLRRRCRPTSSRHESLESRLCLSIEAAAPSAALDADANLMSQSAANATNLNGASVAVYSDLNSGGTGKGNDVWLRRFDAGGKPIAASQRVNTTLAGAQMNVDVAAINADDYVVVWQSENQDGDGWGVYARVKSAGTWSGEILVNQTTAGNQVTPKVTYGVFGFVVTWCDRDANSGNGEIYARAFSYTGTPQTNEIKVSDGGNFAHTAPDIALGFGASIDVVWVASDIANAGQTDVRLRRLNVSSLTPLASPVTVNTITAGDQSAPSISQFAMNSGIDDLIVAWQDTSNGGEAAIFARRMDGQGVQSFSQFEVSQDSQGGRTRPIVAAYPGGTVVIGWTQQVAGASSSSTVTRIYDGSLAPVTSETPVTDGSTIRTLQGLTVTGNGKFFEITTVGESAGFGIPSVDAFNNVLSLVGTSGNDSIVAYDLDSNTVRASVNGTTLNYLRASYDHIHVDLGAGNDTLIANDCSFAASVDGGEGNDTLTATSATDTISGGDGDDWIHAGAGSDYGIGNGGIDRMWGDDGDDTLTGGAGKDTIWGGNGKDRLSGSGSPDCLFGEADDDRLYGELGDDRCDGGGGKDRLYGDDGNDLLVGNSSNDRIYAGDGNDTLNGGQGNDYLEGGNGTDTVLAKEPGDLLVGVELS